MRDDDLCTCPDKPEKSSEIYLSLNTYKKLQTVKPDLGMRTNIVKLNSLLSQTSQCLSRGELIRRCFWYLMNSLFVRNAGAIDERNVKRVDESCSHFMFAIDVQSTKLKDWMRLSTYVVALSVDSVF